MLVERAGVTSASITARALGGDGDNICAEPETWIYSRNVGEPGCAMSEPDIDRGWYDVGLGLRWDVGNRFCAGTGVGLGLGWAFTGLSIMVVISRCDSKGEVRADGGAETGLETRDLSSYIVFKEILA